MPSKYLTIVPLSDKNVKMLKLNQSKSKMSLFKPPTYFQNSFLKNRGCKSSKGKKRFLLPHRKNHYYKYT